MKLRVKKMTAKSDSLEKIMKDIIAFRDKRNWQQFHKIKDLLIGLNIETAELMEHFLWKDDKEIQSMLKNKKCKKEIENEIADIFIFLTYICHFTKIDLKSATQRKLSLNKKKYPVKKSINSNLKYDKL